jgi:hypothetical protein
MVLFLRNHVPYEHERTEITVEERTPLSSQKYCGWYNQVIWWRCSWKILQTDRRTQTLTIHKLE